MAGGGIVGVLMACACLALCAPLASCGGEDEGASSAAVAPAPLHHSHSGAANVLVVVDVSQEMDGDRLAKARAGLDALVRALPADDRVGLASFSDHFEPVVPVLDARANRGRLRAAIRGLKAGGDSAPYDSTLQAYGIQRELAGGRRLNSVLVLAHGEDSASQSSFARVKRLLGSQRDGPRVRVFTVAYDTDSAAGLRAAFAAFARASRGKSFTATQANVGRMLRRAWQAL